MKTCRGWLPALAALVLASWVAPASAQQVLAPGDGFETSLDGTHFGGADRHADGRVVAVDGDGQTCTVTWFGADGQSVVQTAQWGATTPDDAPRDTRCVGVRAIGDDAVAVLGFVDDGGIPYVLTGLRADGTTIFEIELPGTLNVPGAFLAGGADGLVVVGQTLPQDDGPFLMVSRFNLLGEPVFQETYAGVDSCLASASSATTVSTSTALVATGCGNDDAAQVRVLSAAGVLQANNRLDNVGVTNFVPSSITAAGTIVTVAGERLVDGQAAAQRVVRYNNNNSNLLLDFDVPDSAGRVGARAQIEVGGDGLWLLTQGGEILNLELFSTGNGALLAEARAIPGVPLAMVALTTTGGRLFSELPGGVSLFSLRAVDPEVCDDQADNDEDGDTDCADFDCAFGADCLTATAIAEPGASIELVGSLDDTDFQWDRPSAACVGGGLADHYFDVFAITNPGDGPRTLTVTASWLDDGFLHVYRDSFDPTGTDTCVVGDDDFGIDGSQITDLTIEAGQTLFIVASTFSANDAIGPYTITVDTRADAEVCDGGLDEDNDGDIDCDDADCTFDPGCFVIEATPIAGPGGDIELTGSLDDTDPLWDRPNAGCTGGGGNADTFFDVFAVINNTGATQTINVTAAWADDGYLHVYRDSFDPTGTDTCVVGNDDFGGRLGSQVTALTIEAGQTLFIVASAFSANDAIGPYTITVDTVAEDEICEGGVDEDNDGDIDCDDSDCAFLPGCFNPVATPIADAGQSLELSGSIDDTDPRWDRPSAVCFGTGDPPAHFFDVFPVINNTGAAQVLTATAAWSGDGYLHVYRDPFDPTSIVSCIRGNDDFNGAGASQLAEVNIGAGETLFFVASTFDAGDAIGAYTLTIETLAGVEICDNGQDDDNDGDVDCDDADCEADLACQPDVEICGNGQDDDNDGDVDCDDADCAFDEGCVPPEVCDDQADNDGDGDIDCDDADCAGDPACVEPVDEVCDNGNDDDLDGDTDCDDADCADAPVCQVDAELCGDGEDNDDDGDVDCDDADCAADPVCFNPDLDRDLDGVNDDVDNCPDDANTDQGDVDGDGLGDACDSDIDGDNFPNSRDNCPSVANPLQQDLDLDQLGDACDSDIDGDGVANGDDNCSRASNRDQRDTDRDGRGDACDGDIDGDEVANGPDNCDNTPNPDQRDRDGDGLGDACDPSDNRADADRDGVVDLLDNCPDVANPQQSNLDQDSRGDICDDDDDGDGVLDDEDNCPTVPNFLQEDVDGDGIGDFCDDPQPGPPSDSGEVVNEPRSTPPTRTRQLSGANQCAVGAPASPSPAGGLPAFFLMALVALAVRRRR